MAPYVRSYAQWFDSPTKTTPISAAALNNIETGISNISETVEALPATYQPLSDDLTDIVDQANVRGDMLVWGTAGWERLPKSSTSTHVLTAGALQPGWAAPTAGTGDVATDTIWVAAGDLVVGSGSHTAAVLSKGSTGQVLTAGAGTISWAALPTPKTVANDTIWDAAGDLAVGTGSDTAGKLSKGSALQVLRVNAGATGLEWATPAAGPGGAVDADDVDVTANLVGTRYEGRATTLGGLLAVVEVDIITQSSLAATDAMMAAQTLVPVPTIAVGDSPFAVPMPGSLVPVDTTSGNVTVNLLDAPAAGARVAVHKLVALNSITVKAFSGTTVAVLTLAGESIDLSYDADEDLWYPRVTAPSPTRIINTDGDRGRTIFVGTIDPDVAYTPETGDVWIEVP